MFGTREKKAPQGGFWGETLGIFGEAAPTEMLLELTNRGGGGKGIIPWLVGINGKGGGTMEETEAELVGTPGTSGEEDTSRDIEFKGKQFGNESVVKVSTADFKALLAEALQ